MQQAHYFVTFPIREFNKLSVTVFLAKQTILCVCVYKQSGENTRSLLTVQVEK